MQVEFIRILRYGWRYPLMPLLSLSFFALERTIDMMLYNDWFALGVIMVFSGCRTATELDPPIERFLNAIIVILLVNHDLFWHILLSKMFEITNFRVHFLA